MINVNFHTSSSIQLGEGLGHVAFLLEHDPEVTKRVRERLNTACNAVLIEEIENLKGLVL
jgi:hypothetical protein